MNLLHIDYFALKITRFEPFCVHLPCTEWIINDGNITIDGIQFEIIYDIARTNHFHNNNEQPYIGKMHTLHNQHKIYRGA